jgi:uncharacterized membrane protein YphA (DoxX/SURF4 family)
MKIAAIIARILMGLIFLMASITFLFKMYPEPQLEGPMKTLMDGFNASGYLLHTVKVIELICGLAFVSGFFVPLAVVVIFPIIVNIVGVHFFLMPQGLPMALLLLVLDLFLAYYYRDRYRPLLQPK